MPLNGTPRWLSNDGTNIFGKTQWCTAEVFGVSVGCLLMELIGRPMRRCWSYYSRYSTYREEHLASSDKHKPGARQTVWENWVKQAWNGCDRHRPIDLLYRRILIRFDDLKAWKFFIHTQHTRASFVNKYSIAYGTHSAGPGQETIDPVDRVVSQSHKLKINCSCAFILHKKIQSIE